MALAMCPEPMTLMLLMMCSASFALSRSSQVGPQRVGSDMLRQLPLVRLMIRSRRVMYTDLRA
jgi:hypothetical protein